MFVVYSFVFFGYQRYNVYLPTYLPTYHTYYAPFFPPWFYSIFSVKR